MKENYHESGRRVAWRHNTRNGRFLFIMALAAVFALLAVLVCIATAIGSTAQAQPGAAAVALPAFVMDPSLPAQIVINADQGLGQSHWVDPGIIGRSYVSWAYDTSPSSSGWRSTSST